MASQGRTPRGLSSPPETRRRGRDHPQHFIPFALVQIAPRDLPVWRNLLSPVNAMFQFLPFHQTFFFFFNDIVFPSGLLFLLFLLEIIF